MEDYSLTYRRCGPRKLAKSLALCLERLAASNKPNKAQPTPNEALREDIGGHTQREDESRVDTTSKPNQQKRGEQHDNPKANDPPLQHPRNDVADMNREHKAGSVDKGAASRTSLPTRTLSYKTIPKTLRNVLLVDDNKINLQLLVTYTNKSGHNFITAMNGQEALEAYRKQFEDHKSSATKDKGEKKRNKTSPSATAQEASPFDFVLMDLSMPIMDGLESTRHIRAYERANNVRPTTIIALTGLASASAQQEAYSSGVNTFMTKPVKLKDLGKILDDGVDTDT